MMAIVIAMTISTVLGIIAIRDTGKRSSEQMLQLLCETGQKNLNSHFLSVQQSVGMVASFATKDLETRGTDDLAAHMESVQSVFNNLTDHTQGVLTYYYRLDPSFSQREKGFWYVYNDRRGFTPHEVTDIESYDENDTSKLVWYTVPKSTGEACWLPPYITENLGARVLSYNVPVYYEGEFIGVVGIELDYTMMAATVNNIRLYDHGYAFIIDAEGNIIYHPRIDVLTLSEKDIPKTPEGLVSDNFIVEYEYDGVEKIGCCLELVNGMRLNVVAPVSEIDGDWVSLINWTIIVSLFILILFVFVSIQVASNITSPLIRLTEAAEQVNEGNYDVELEDGGNDEIGVLTQTFKLLLEKLKARIGELNTLNKNLQEDNLTLEAATVRDSLTGVKNRFALRRDYDKYVESDIHIMMLDIDDFKHVNDTFGHSVGDFLLKKVGDALLDHFGADHSYRYGGDEFLVIFPDISEEDFQKAIKDLEQQLEEIYLEDRKLPVHFSAGYVYGKASLNDDLRLMLRQADELLYKAKQQGKNSFIGGGYDRENAEGIKKKEVEAFRHG